MLEESECVRPAVHELFNQFERAKNSVNFEPILDNFNLNNGYNGDFNKEKNDMTFSTQNTKPSGHNQSYNQSSQHGIRGSTQ